MRRLALTLSALTLVTTAFGAAFLDLPDRAGKAWVVCDALDPPRTLVIGTPDASGRAVITTLDHRTGRRAHEAWQVGRADPGAGSVYHALKPRTGAPGGPGDAVRLLNPGVSVSPDLYAFTPALVSVTLRGETNTCRLLPGTRLLGVTARRTVLVTQDAAGRLTYRSYDFARPAAPLGVPGDGVARTTVPTAEVTGGARLTVGGGAVYRFEKGGYRYDVRVDGAHAGVTVSRAGRALQREPLLAFETGGPAR